MTAPRIRAGDSDRQQSVDRLARHFTQGRLDSYEPDERVRKAFASVYLDELPRSSPICHRSRSPQTPTTRPGVQATAPIDQRVFSGLGQTRPPLRRVQQLLAFAFLAIAVLFIVGGHPRACSSRSR